jgi:CBS domain-containing protein
VLDSLDACRYHRDELRAARAAALEDAEGFPQVLFAIERLGSRPYRRVESLGNYRDVLEKLAAKSPLAWDLPERFPSWHSSFTPLFRLVKDGRNDALHQGASARALTQHAVQLALVLEDALMSDADMVRDFMVRDPATALPWQPISAARQTMLAQSYSFLPVRLPATTSWQLVSDSAIARYLRLVDKSERKRRLAATVEEAVGSGQLALEEPTTCRPLELVTTVLERSASRVALVLDEDQPDHLVGILTPFDLL